MTMRLHRDRQRRGSRRRSWSVESLEDRVVLSGEITEFPVVSMPPGVISGLDAIASGPDGNVWFTIRNQGKIGSIDATGNVVTYALPNHAANPDPTSLVTGPDGDLWFTESNADAIGRFDPRTRSFDTFALPSAFNVPESIAVGPDGNLWFGDSTSQQFGRITTDGIVTAFPIPKLVSTNSIAPGPDGNLWFTSNAIFSAQSGVIGRISPSGDLTVFPVAGGAPSGITAGPDGNLWFLDIATNAVGRITPEGDITEFPAGAGGQVSGSITSGPDGNLWFTTTTAIGQITPQGVMTSYSLPASGGAATQITTGPDGNLWFTQESTGQIGRLALSPIAVPAQPSTPPPATPSSKPPPVGSSSTSHTSTKSSTKPVVAPTILGNLRALKLFEKQIVRLMQQIHPTVRHPVKLPRVHVQVPHHPKPRHAR